jgi:hypothetical protein
MNKETLFSCTPRQGVIAKPGHSIVSIDYASQELVVASVLSADQVMLDSYRQNTIKKDNEGNPYPNPWTDLHTISAKNCISPSHFENKDESQWVKIAKTTRLPGKKQTLRDLARFWPFLK